MAAETSSPGHVLVGLNNSWFKGRGMRLVTVKLPELFVEGLDQLVRMGRYSSRSEAIRVAIRDLLRRELWRTIWGDDG